MWLNLERTVDKRGRTAKKGHHFADTTMTKKVASFLQEKIGSTPSVAAPGDTNPSDATVAGGLSSTERQTLTHNNARIVIEQTEYNATASKTSLSVMYSSMYWTRDMPRESRPIFPSSSALPLSQTHSA